MMTMVGRLGMMMMVGILGGSSSSMVGASDAATCSASSFVTGHDFKNMQYAHVNGTSPEDWCAIAALLA